MMNHFLGNFVVALDSWCLMLSSEIKSWACLYERRDGTFTRTGRFSSRIYMNFLHAGQ